MYLIGFVIVVVAGVGVLCGLLGLADAIGIVNLDAPEVGFFGEEDDG